MKAVRRKWLSLIKEYGHRNLLDFLWVLKVIKAHVYEEVDSEMIDIQRDHEWVKRRRKANVAVKNQSTPNVPKSVKPTKSRNF